MEIKQLKNFDDFINESDGYGNKKFFLIKDADSFHYLFKLDSIEESEERAFDFCIGKYSKFELPEGPKNSFCISSLKEITIEELEDCITESYPPAVFIHESKIDEGESSRIFNIFSACYMDYLGKNSKISRIFDEVQETTVFSDYENKIKGSINKILGEDWNIQEGTNKNILIISR